MGKIADASPTKEFFVHMVTKDISLEDCILDLIDNCIDGARKSIFSSNSDIANIDNYDGYCVNLHLNSEEFRIEDNCGGISVADAIDYAFHFGRRPDSPSEDKFSIGLYGIGMKRALLKIGKNIRIHSSTADEAFICEIDVDNWLSHDRWEFDLDDAELMTNSGTVIKIQNLNDGIDAEFDSSTFVNSLSRIIGRDYALFIDKGFKISVNDNSIASFGYAIKASDEFLPYRNSYEDEGVIVEIIAGMAAPPPDDLEPSDRQETGYYGWFVLCNDRVVLPADRSDLTVWGDEGFPKWHFQYNGFMGLVLFHSADPRLLPWTTTKRDVDENSRLYRRAVSEMKKATRPWLEYTNQRKADLEGAKAKEKVAVSIPLSNVKESDVLRLPTPKQLPKIKMANIQYQRPQSEVQLVRDALGQKNLPYRTVGELTFEYFLQNEVDD